MTVWSTFELQAKIALECAHKHFDCITDPIRLATNNFNELRYEYIFIRYDVALCKDDFEKVFVCCKQFL